MQENPFLNLEKFKINKTIFRSFPEDPGIYIYWNEEKPIYIGKASNLKNRLHSYLSQKLFLKTRRMMQEADSVSYVKVASDFEAILLEAHLIRKYQPRYNMMAKDDKHPLYIQITDEEYPRVITARKKDEIKSSKSRFYGPFPSSKTVYSVLRTIRRIFPYSDHPLTKKRCLYSHLGLCNPCPSYINSIDDAVIKGQLQKRYKENIRYVRLVLERRVNYLSQLLNRKMVTFAKRQEYESAQEVKDKLVQLEYITSPRFNKSEFLANPNFIEDLRRLEMIELTELIKPFYPDIKEISRVECYDIAHLQGAKPTASMVTFIRGDADKSLYRHFKILQSNTQSDTASLAEVAKRRVKHLEKWGKPDLVIVDGGKGQVKIFHELFFSYNIPVVGIAKRYETLIVPVIKNDKLSYQEIRLKEGNVYNFITRIRNEAHRFARRYHHLLLKKSLF